MTKTAVLASLLAVAVVAGCGGSPDQSTTSSPRLEPSAPVEIVSKRGAACGEPSVRSLRDARSTLAATVVRTTVARRGPSVAGPPVARFDPINVNGVPTVLGVLALKRGVDCRPSWYRVQLPIRPNGTTGWVRALDVRLRPVATRIEIDLSERRVTLLVRGAVAVETTAAIGKAGTPTPVGSYYVNQRLRPSDPGGPYGPGAVGISAFSPTLVDWPQGGPIAIHGTNQPHSIGDAASNGCLRVSNAALLEIYDLAVEGTPVTITY